MIDARFIRRVVPDIPAGTPAYVGVWIKDQVVWGRAFSDKQAALNFANAMVGRPVDVFFGMSLQSATKPAKKNARGRTVLPAEKLADLAVLLQAFWLDIDLKGGYFKDTAQALKEVGEWRRAAGLPMPSLVVMTGSGGFHLYWILDQPITKAVWEPLAWALRTAATLYFKPRPNPKGGRDLTLDFGLTTDAGRILRAPGSLNHKTSPPNPVFIAHEDRDYTLAEWDAALAPHKVSNYAPSVTTPRVTMRLVGKPSAMFVGVQLPGPLDAGLDETSYVPTLEEVIDGGCDFLKNTKATGGAGHSQTLWFEVMKCTVYMQDGNEVAHELSNQWVSPVTGERYEEAEVDKMYDRVVGERKGWPHCKQINSAGATECTTCRHWPPAFEKQSPLHFALPKAAVSAIAAAALAVSPVATSHAVPTPTVAYVNKVEWPQGYRQDPDGIVYTMIEDPRDPDKPAVRANVMPYPILNMWAHRPSAAGGQWAISMVVQTTRTDIIEASVSYKEYMDPRKLKDTLGEQGIGLDPGKYIPVLGKLMASFVEKLRTSSNRIEDSYSLGWHRSKTDGHLTGFVYDGMLRNGSGNRPVTILGRDVRELYTPCGSLDDWKRIAGLIFAQRRPSLDAIIAVSLGSPLISLLGYKGGIFSSWSPETGMQKTNTTKLAQSFWGDPAKGLGGLADTPNFVVMRLSTLGSLPYCWDDLQTSEDNRKFAHLVMQGPQGRSKGRTHRAGLENNPVLTWGNTIIVNSNSALVKVISDVMTQTVAGTARVLEQRIEANRTGLGMVNRTFADMEYAKLEHNFGRPGAIMADFLGGRTEDFLQDCLKRTRDAVMNHIGGRDEDRFHASMVAAGLVGAKFGNHLGLTDFDLDALSGYLPELIQEQRGERKMSLSDLTSPSALEGIISHYLTFRGDCTLVTERVRTTPGKAPAGWDVGRINSNTLRLVHVRVATETKIMRISLADFENWVAKDRKIGRSVIVDHLTRTLPGLAVTKSDLGQGVSHYETHRQLVLEFDLNKYDFF